MIRKKNDGFPLILSRKARKKTAILKFEKNRLKNEKNNKKLSLKEKIQKGDRCLVLPNQPGNIISINFPFKLIFLLFFFCTPTSDANKKKCFQPAPIPRFVRTNNSNYIVAFRSLSCWLRWKSFIFRYIIRGSRKQKERKKKYRGRTREFKLTSPVALWIKVKSRDVT